MNPEVKKKKQLLGLVYGMVSGLAFAGFTWAVDAWVLAQANSTYPWVKCLPALIICVLAGGLAGWLTMRFENHGIAFLLWGSLGLLFSWLVIWIPLTWMPDVIRALDPELAAWFDFSRVAGLNQFWLYSLLICEFAAIISGLLEINLVKQAMFSPYRAVSAMTILVCVVLMGLAGSAMDHMVNTNFREPVQVVDEMLQFAADHQGQEVPKTTARMMHLSAARHLDELLQKSRQLTLIAFEPSMGMMDILVDFEGVLVRCTAIYAQPTDCIVLSETP